MRKTILPVLLLGFLFLLGHIDNVMAHNSIKIGVLKIEELAKNSLVMKDIQRQLSDKQAEFQKEINEKQIKLEKGKKDKKNKVLEQEINEKQNSLKQASLDSITIVNSKLEEILAKIRKERKLDMILSNNQVLSYDETQDISDEVIKELDKALPKLEVLFK